jgi:hypothetical protein
MPGLIGPPWMARSLLIGIIASFAIGARAMAEDQQKISLPTDHDLAELKTRNKDVQKLLQSRYGKVSLTKSKTDLALLQKLVDDGVPSKSETYKLQSLGLVLGEVFAKELELHWVIVEDEYGRDLALQYEKSSMIVFPLTMISKRIEKGEKPKLSSLFEMIQEELGRFKKKADPIHQ